MQDLFLCGKTMTLEKPKYYGESVKILARTGLTLEIEWESCVGTVLICRVLDGYYAEFKCESWEYNGKVNLFWILKRISNE